MNDARVLFTTDVSTTTPSTAAPTTPAPRLPRVRASALVGRGWLTTRPTRSRSGGAVERYEVHHPVLDDPELTTWSARRRRGLPLLG